MSEWKPLNVRKSRYPWEHVVELCDKKSGETALAAWAYGTDGPDGYWSDEETHAPVKFIPTHWRRPA